MGPFRWVYLQAKGNGLHEEIIERQEQKVKKDSIFFIIVFLTDNIKIGGNTIQPDSNAISAQSAFYIVCFWNRNKRCLRGSKNPHEP